MRRVAALLLCVLAAACGAPAAPVDPGAPQRIDVHYAGGAAVGGVANAKVALGATVDLVLTSDVAQDLHLHGYDRLVSVPAGGSAELTFVADIPGVFTAEAEQAGTALVRLEVS